MKRARLIALSGLAAGCAGAAPPTAPVERAPPAERAAVVYEIGNGHVSPLPLVRGSVGGRRTLMVVDTGTGGTVIAAWLARALKLETTEVAQSTHDPSGRPVVIERYDAPRLLIDGFEPLPDRPTAIIELPAQFEAGGIGVILSPQALASADFAIILDMPRREMRRVRSRDAADTSPGGTFEVERPVLCSEHRDVFWSSRLTATAIIDGVSTVLEVDTGAFGAPFFLVADTDVGRKVLARPSIGESGLSAAGPLDVVTARDVPVRVGARERLSSVTVMPGAREAHCGIEGRIGLEILRACVFTIGERTFRLRCEEGKQR